MMKEWMGNLVPRKIIESDDKVEVVGREIRGRIDPTRRTQKAEER
jgi:hypothetical protein